MQLIIRDLIYRSPLKFFVWREVSKSFTRSIIEFIFNPLNLFVGYFMYLFCGLAIIVTFETPRFVL